MGGYGAKRSLSFFIQTFLSARSKARFLLQLLYKQTIPGAIPFFNILSFLIIFLKKQHLLHRFFPDQWYSRSVFCFAPSPFFPNQKRPARIFYTLTAFASREARRRAAAFPIQLTGNSTRPVSRGTCRATAVKPRPTGMSPEHPARLRRAVRGKGRREEDARRVAQWATRSALADWTFQIIFEKSTVAQWAQPPQAVSDRQPSTETRIWHGSAKDDD